MMQKVFILACVAVACQAMANKRQRAESIEGRVELEYQAKITAVKKVIRETMFVTATETIIDSPYCVSYARNLNPCTPTPEPITPSKTTKRMAKSMYEPFMGRSAAPALEGSISEEGEMQVIELEGIRSECMDQNEGVTFLTTLLETRTVTVTRTRPGAQTVTISIDGCLPSPMPFNAPKC